MIVFLSIQVRTGCLTSTVALTEKFEVALASLKLVKANIGFDGNSRTGVAKIGVVT